MSNSQKLRELVQDVFLLDPAEFRLDLTRDEIDTWDSLGVVSLAVGIHDTFGYHMSPDEAAHLGGLGDLVALRTAMESPLTQRPEVWTLAELRAAPLGRTALWTTASVARIVRDTLALDDEVPLEEAETLVVAGGGTLIDAAKLRAREQTRPVRLIAIPSIWGSGAEASPIAVGLEGGRKVVHVDPRLLPDVRVVWPELGASVPRERARVACGDAWAHALEGFLSPLASDELRRELAAVITTMLELPIAFDPRWFEASAIACAGQARSSVGLVHGIAHVLEQDRGRALDARGTLRDVASSRDRIQPRPIGARPGFVRRTRPLAARDPREARRVVRRRRVQGTTTGAGESVADCAPRSIDAHERHAGAARAPAASFRISMSELLAYPPYSERRDALLLEEMNAVTRHHLERNEVYRRIWPKWQQASSLDEIPFLHAGVFKHLRLASGDAARARTLVSSGTTGTQSQVVMDADASRLQAASSKAILAEFIGSAMTPLLILDHAAALRSREAIPARIAAAMAVSRSQRKPISCSPPMTRWTGGASRKRSRNSDHVRVYAITSLLWTAWLATMPDALRAELRRVRIDFVHSGGWKKLEAIRVDRALLERTLLEVAARGLAIVTSTDSWNRTASSSLSASPASGTRRSGVK